MDLKDFDSTLDISEAATPPASWYLSPEVLELERKSLFFNSWQQLTRTENLKKPGDFLSFDLMGEPILLLQGDSGLQAMSNVCRHRASTLLEGCGSAKSIRCPYHSWTYDLSGKLVGQPEFQGVKNWEKDSIRLPQFETETWGPLTFIRLQSGGPSLNSLLGNIPKEMKEANFDMDGYSFVRRKDYEIPCNWKVYVDNYLEGYHIPSIHPALFEEVDYNAYRVETFDSYCSHIAPFRARNSSKERRYGEQGKSDLALYYWLFPNFMINIYPDLMHTTWVIPLSPDRTLTRFEWFASSQYPLSEEDLEQSVAFNDRTQAEDIAICERVQRGLASSTYNTGRYSVKRENGVHHFHKMLHQSLSS